MSFCSQKPFFPFSIEFLSRGFEHLSLHLCGQTCLSVPIHCYLWAPPPSTICMLIYHCACDSSTFKRGESSEESDECFLAKGTTREKLSMANQRGTPRLKVQGTKKNTEQWKALSKPQNGEQMGFMMVHQHGIIQLGRRSEVLRVPLPRLNVLKTQMGKDVLFCCSCQELFLEKEQASKHNVNDKSSFSR